MAQLTFLGAARQVTGSCYLIETRSGSKVLLECGMRQGRRENRGEEGSRFAFDPAELSAVVISHAHIDHTGLLPRLVADGYRGPIFATRVTCELMELMLLDAALLQERDAEWENKWRTRSGKAPLKPLYSTGDAERTLAQRQPLDYGQPTEVAPGVELTYHEAGHILGSAIVELVIEEAGTSRRLVFSGDLGNTCSPLMRNPALLSRADMVMLESTYGDRDHRDNEETLEEFATILAQAHHDGGNVLIPSFAVGRTQDLIYYLGQFHKQGRLAQQAAFLDSPMAIRANAIYSRYHEHLAEQHGRTVAQGRRRRIEDWLPILRCTPSADESMAINKIRSGAIIIAGSGMCTGGRILHHFKHNLWREQCHLIFPGFQARGTLGRLIVDGAKSVKLLHQRIAVNARVHTLGGFSAHAGQSQLIDWVQHFETRPKLYLVHGELEKMQVLQQRLEELLDWRARIPEPGEQVSI